MTRIFIAIPSVGVCDTRFAISLASLKKPPGTAIASSPRSITDVARNSLFEQALKFGYDYVFFLDDDMVLDAGLLEALKKTMDEDASIAALAPLAFRRHPPFLPCVFKHRRDHYYDPLDLDAVEPGLVDVDALHFAATLVRSSALAKIPPPRFEFIHVKNETIGEDIALSSKLQQSGARLVCDTRLEALHISLPPLVGRDAYEAARRAKGQVPERDLAIRVESR